MKKKGFTLLETAIVIIVIGLLAGLVMPNYRKAIRKSEWVDALAVLDFFYKTVRMYYEQYDVWPFDGGTGVYWNWMDTDCAGINNYLTLLGSVGSIPIKACDKFNYDLYAWGWQEQCAAPGNPNCAIYAYRKGPWPTTFWGMRKRLDTSGVLETNDNNINCSTPTNCYP